MKRDEDVFSTLTSTLGIGERRRGHGMHAFDCNKELFEGSLGSSNLASQAAYYLDNLNFSKRVKEIYNTPVSPIYQIYQAANKS